MNIANRCQLTSSALNGPDARAHTHTHTGDIQLSLVGWNIHAGLSAWLVPVLGTRLAHCTTVLSQLLPVKRTGRLDCAF